MHQLGCSVSLGTAGIVGAVDVFSIVGVSGSVGISGVVDVSGAVDVFSVVEALKTLVGTSLYPGITPVAWDRATSSLPGSVSHTSAFRWASNPILWVRS